MLEEEELLEEELEEEWHIVQARTGQEHGFGVLQQQLVALNVPDVQFKHAFAVISQPELLDEELEGLQEQSTSSSVPGC